MKLYLFICFLFVEGKKDAKIIGGRFARKNEFPFAVALFTDFGQFCTGTLATLDRVITAGHCVAKSGPVGFVANDKITVVGGSINKSIKEKDPGKQIRRVSRAQLHPGYRFKRSGTVAFHDIALCTLSERFEASESLSPMKWISRSPSVLKKEYERVLDSGEECIGVGWGYTEKGVPMTSTLLKAISLKPERPDYCRTFAREGEDMTEKGEVCLSADEGTGICSGDSGGPLVCGGFVLALLSSALGNECAKKEYPANYIMYWPYMDMINSGDFTMSLAAIFHQSHFFLFSTFINKF